MSSLLLLSLSVSTADAARLPLDPMNRLHAGVSVADGPIGFQLGLDSRMTRMIYVDIGGFGSPIALPEMEFAEDTAKGDFVFLRHGMYVAPGFRVPHRGNDAFTWDLFVRGTMAAVWSYDLDPDNYHDGLIHEIETDPALGGGADLLVQKGKVGLRLSGKVLYFKPYSPSAYGDLEILRTQYALEAVYQW